MQRPYYSVRQKQMKALQYFSQSESTTAFSCLNPQNLITDKVDMRT